MHFFPVSNNSLKLHCFFTLVKLSCFRNTCILLHFMSNWKLPSLFQALLKMEQYKPICLPHLFYQLHYIIWTAEIQVPYYYLSVKYFIKHVYIIVKGHYQSWSSHSQFEVFVLQLLQQEAPKNVFCTLHRKGPASPLQHYLCPLQYVAGTWFYTQVKVKRVKPRFQLRETIQ